MAFLRRSRLVTIPLQFLEKPASGSECHHTAVEFGRGGCCEVDGETEISLKLAVESRQSSLNRTGGVVMKCPGSGSILRLEVR